MKFGIVSYNTEYGIRPDVAAREAEARGYESIWLPEHTHIPVSRETPFPLGGELPEEYKHFMDLFVSMTAAAMATTTLKVAAGICLLVEHDPIVVAKAVATLDYLSGGRVMFGIGGGWNREEMANHGTAFEQRWKILRERVAALKAMWTEEQASFHGEFVDFEPIWCYPKPVQKPHPPIYLGAVSKAGLKRVVDYCDGWLLVDPNDDSLERATRELDVLCAARGRARESISMTVFATRVVDAALVERYAAAGVERTIVWLPPDSADVALQVMDAAAPLIERYR
ncbi:MAG: LLM class F420-dependent oxidoreductase [Gammaproteobacteria bacterium]|nr:LLM class F420-dependent oxidoreductase [Gammaproteobacteria bacterium]MCP5200284.1 LLM class F420-dependent oxidoreductase [Gammaproteobacteria bacterium]